MLGFSKQLVTISSKSKTGDRTLLYGEKVYLAVLVSYLNFCVTTL